jgi:SET domain/Tetratricopeptide repeat
MDVLLKSIPLYINHEEIQKLQSQPNAEELVANQVAAVIDELASELLASVAAELSSPNVVGCVKNLSQAEELRTSGNASFSKGKYLEAVELFSRSLTLLSHSSSRSAFEAETCVKVLCNRALCLSKLKLHNLAENDSSEAISMKPDHAKAYYRRSIAYRDQNEFNKAKIDVERAVKLLEQQGGATEEAETLLGSLLKKCTINNGGGKNGSGGGGDDVLVNEFEWTTHSVPQELWNEEGDVSSSNLTSSAAATSAMPINWSCSALEISKLMKTRAMEPNSIRLTESARLGRHLVVNTREMKENIDIIEDQPVAHALAKRQRLRRCGHCCQELPLNGAYYWPCRACCVAVFCSQGCRDHENVHHVEGGPECGVPWTALLPPDVVLAVRLACRLKRDQQRGNIAKDNDGDKETASSKVVSSLQTCFSKLDTEEAIWRATTACAAHAAWTLAYQRSITKYTAIAPSPISIADVLRALGIVKLNGLAMVPPAFGSEEDSIGLAIYPVASFLSHSCIPNVSVRFEGNTAIIRTLSTLEAGTPLNHCYGPQAGEMTTAQRRMMLKDQYHFICECDACVIRSGGGGTAAAGTVDKNEEVEKEAEMVGLKCYATEGCLGAMQVPLSTSATDSNGAAFPGSSVIDAGICSKYDLRIEDEKNLRNISGGCTKCGAEILEIDWNSRIAPRLAKAFKCFSTGCSMLENREEGGKLSKEEMEKAVNFLEESLKIRQELLHKYNQVLGATHNALFWVEGEDLSSSKKDPKTNEESKKIMHSRASLEIAERLYPADSTNIAFERLKLGTMLQQSGSKDAVKEGKGLASAAITTLERYFGSAAAAAAV